VRLIPAELRPGVGADADDSNDVSKNLLARNGICI